jgi:hypothetical protein
MANKKASQIFELVYPRSGSVLYILESGIGYKITLDNLFRFYNDTYLLQQVFDPTVTDDLGNRYARGHVISGNFLITGGQSGVVFRVYNGNLIVNGTGIFSGLNKGVVDLGHSNITAGRHAISMGVANNVYGDHNSAYGRYNIVRGEENYAYGKYNSVSGTGNGVFGQFNSVTGEQNLFVGFKNLATGRTGISVFGNDNVAHGYDLTIVGKSNNISGDYSDVFGRKNKIEAVAGVDNVDIFGRYNYTKGKDVSIHGQFNTNVGDSFDIFGSHNYNYGSPSGIIYGSYNYVDTGAGQPAIFGMSNDLFVSQGASIYGHCNEVRSSQSFTVGNRNILGTSAHYTYVFGYKNSGNCSGDVLIGFENTSYSDDSYLIGRGNINRGVFSFMMGFDNIMEEGAANCSALGENCTVRSLSSNSIVMGVSNDLSGAGSAVIGGSVHLLKGDNSFIGGGAGNWIINANGAAIIGGSVNKVSGHNSIILAGQLNRLNGVYSAIVAGYNNLNQGGGFNTILNGQLNLLDIDTSYCTIGGGFNNKIRGIISASVIANGFSNLINLSTNCFIGAGTENQMVPDSHHSSIVGGVTNIMSGQRCFIGGGDYAFMSGDYNVIVGGNGNVIIGKKHFIGGGVANRIETYGILDEGNFIGAGYSNGIYNSTTSVICGGYVNVIYDSACAILGGEINIASGHHSVVLGGKFNDASGIYGLAWGFRSKIRSTHSGAAIFSDLRNVDKLSFRENSFTFHYQNGVVVSGSNLLVDGNVGVGTAVPGASIHVKKAGLADIIVESLTTSDVAYRFSRNGSLKWSIYSPNANNLSIFNHSLSSDALTILTSNNNVGLGTSNPWEHLEISGAGNQRVVVASNNSNAGFIADAAAGSNASLFLKEGGTQFWELTHRGSDNRFLIYSSSFGTAISVNNTNGQVGIGHENPTHALDVTGDLLVGNGAIRIRNSNWNLGDVAKNVSNDLYIGEFNDWTRICIGEGTAITTFANNGRVGIGNITAPTYMLHVNGSIGINTSASGALFIGNNQVVTGRMGGYTLPLGVAIKTGFNSNDTTTVAVTYVQTEVQQISDRLTETRKVLKGLWEALDIRFTGHGLLGA